MADDGYMTIGIRHTASMSAHPRRKKYVPPIKRASAWLSDALESTNRFPNLRQKALIPSEVDERSKFNLRFFYAGELDLLQRPAVAVVGTRKLSENGEKRSHKLARQLVENDIVVVSGLAQGVDTVAHTTALEYGGRTIAVIGTSLDKAYPTDNAALQEEIYRNHLLISQFNSNDRVFRSNFPTRNKLMATVSDATVIMEASDTSGTLHQAAECTRLGRWLFIAKSVAEDPKLTWPAKFLKYNTCVVLTDIRDVLSRVLI